MSISLLINESSTVGATLAVAVTLIALLILGDGRDSLSERVVSMPEVDVANPVGKFLKQFSLVVAALIVEISSKVIKQVAERFTHR
jgi:hypothetical protein